MHPKYNNNLLNLKDVKVYKVEHSVSKVKIHIRTDAKFSKCPHCGQMTYKVHDYPYQDAKGLLIQDKQILLFLKNRRPCLNFGPVFLPLKIGVRKCLKILNTLIPMLKRISYGIKNFKRFRNRIFVFKYF